MDEFDEIDNKTAREILNLVDDDIYKVSRLFKQLREEEKIEVLRKEKGITYYCKVRQSKTL